MCLFDARSQLIPRSMRSCARSHVLGQDAARRHEFNDLSARFEFAAYRFAHGASGPSASSPNRCPCPPVMVRLRPELKMRGPFKSCPLPPLCRGQLPRCPVRPSRAPSSRPLQAALSCSFCANKTRSVRLSPCKFATGFALASKSKWTCASISPGVTVPDNLTCL